MAATQKLPSRTGILIRALIILFVGGMVNSAAVFVNPLAEQFAWSTESVAGVITFMATMQTPGHILSGWMLGKVGAKKTLMIGCVLLGLAFVLSGLVPANAPWLLYVTFSVFQGLGVVSPIPEPPTAPPAGTLTSAASPPACAWPSMADLLPSWPRWSSSLLIWPV